MNISFNQAFPDTDPKIDFKLKEFFRRRFKMERVYLTTSCSSAIEMAAEILGIGQGDEVILPSFTYVMTAMPFVKRGAQLVFADIDPDTYVLDLNDVTRKISARTRLIIPVHYAGVSPDMDQLKRIIGNRRIEILEDAAQGIDAQCGEAFLGTLGTIGVISLHHTKNISTGEGGILILNDPELEEKANVVFEKGTDRHRFISGEIDRYSWTGLGGSYEMSEHLKRLLLDQLGQLDSIKTERTRIHHRYMDQLKEADLKLPRIPEYAESNHHIFAVLLESEAVRNRVIRLMKKAGIQTTFHYQPLHQSDFGKKMGYDRYKLPVTEDIYKRLLRLPIYPGLDNETIDRIAWQLKNILEDSNEIYC